MLQLLAALGQLVFFAGDQLELAEFIDRMASIFFGGQRGGHERFLGGNGLLRVGQGLPGGANNVGGLFQLAKRIKRCAVRRHIDQSAIIVLAVNFDDLAANALQQRRRHRLVIDEGAGAAIGVLHAAQDHIFIIGNGIVAQGGAGRMILGQLQHGNHLPALATGSNERGIAPAPKSQGQRIEKDGFARTSLARQHGHASVERQIELIDQNNIAN